MVKDDYYVIVGKILVYLYARFKDIEKKRTVRLSNTNVKGVSNIKRLLQQSSC